MVYDRLLMCLQIDIMMFIVTKIISTLRTYAAHFRVANSYDTPSRHIQLILVFLASLACSLFVRACYSRMPHRLLPLPF
jgi:hypothetical protein